MDNKPLIFQSSYWKSITAICCAIVFGILFVWVAFNILMIQPADIQTTNLVALVFIIVSIIFFIIPVFIPKRIQLIMDSDTIALKHIYYLKKTKQRSIRIKQINEINFNTPFTGITIENIGLDYMWFKHSEIIEICRYLEGIKNELGLVSARRKIFTDGGIEFVDVWIKPKNDVVTDPKSHTKL